MNVGKLSLSVMMLGLMAASVHAAPIGTAKARGDYSPSAFWNSGNGGSTYASHSRRGYSRRAPVMYSTPSTTTSASTQVAASAPQAAAPTPTQVAAADAGRRFSYDPATGGQAAASGSATSTTTAAPATTSTTTGGTMYYQPATRRASSNRAANVEQWGLQKGDPRKIGG